MIGSFAIRIAVVFRVPLLSVMKGLRLLLSAVLLFPFVSRAQYAVGDYGSTSSGTWTTPGIWSTWNGASWVAAGSIPPVGMPYANVFILAGRTVALPCAAGPTKVNSLTVEVGAKFWTNDCATNTYLYVYGPTLRCNGQIGDGTTFDGLSFGIESTSTLLDGTGTFDCSRIRKNDPMNVTTGLTIARDVNVRFFGGTTTQIYNSANNSIFNVTVNAGCTVTLIGTGGQGNLAMDGTNGNDPSNRGGSYTINGTLIASGTLYLTTNNTANPCSFTINNGGYVRVNSLDMTASGTAGHTLTINSGGHLEVLGTPTAWNAISTTNNPCNLNAGSIFEYSGAGPQNVEGGISGGYGTLLISGTGTKTVNGALIVKGDMDIVNSGGVPTLDVGIANNAVSVAGDWTNYGQAAFNERFGQVTFNGTGPQAITTTGGETFYNKRLGKTAGTVLTMNSDVTVLNQLTFLNGLLDLNSQRLTLSNAATAAITGGAATRYIIAEDVDNSSVVQWNINGTLGAHLIPFGRTGAYLPFTFNLTAGSAGNVSVSTYGTGANNLPWPVAPTPVLNLNSTTGLLPDNRDATVDRFWEVDPTGTPTATLTFTYASTELPIAPYNTPNAMNAQRYDAAVDRWRPATGAQTSTSFSVTAPGITQFGPYALAATLSPLPIELLSFTAEPSGSSVLLAWSTATERDNDHFTLYRSADGLTFEEIGTVPGAGNSEHRENYVSWDGSPLDGTSYYRLRQTDVDGRWTDAPLAVVHRMKSDRWAEVHPWPNPTTAALQVQLPAHGDLDAWLVDADGRVVLQRSVSSGLSLLSMDVSTLPAGMYSLSVTSGTDRHSWPVLVIR